jgi:S-DNA-T family DNA segregation ATPase FtsK/SpoIIIE
MCFIVLECRTDYRFIGSKAYATAYLLPEFVGEGGISMDISERDTLFREAAEILL